MKQGSTSANYVFLKKRKETVLTPTILMLIQKFVDKSKKKKNEKLPNRKLSSSNTMVACISLHMLEVGIFGIYSIVRMMIVG